MEKEKDKILELIEKIPYGEAFSMDEIPYENYNYL